MPREAAVHLFLRRHAPQFPNRGNRRGFVIVPGYRRVSKQSIAPLRADRAGVEEP